MKTLDITNKWLRKLLYQRMLIASIDRRLNQKEITRLKKINEILQPILNLIDEKYKKDTQI